MDVHRIHELLAERNEELSAVAEEIERARAEVQRLENKREKVREIAQELEALISPVRRMPTDIMAKVFEHCVRDEGMRKADPQLTPLLLGQVCRSWRSLLFSLPCLWTTLQLDFPAGAKDWDALMQSKIMSMHVWFSRSKAVPISLFLGQSKGSLIPWPTLMHLDKEILALNCRLKDLTLHFSPRSLSSLLTFAQSPLPYLQHLELQNSNSLPSNENPPAIVLHSAPSLRSFSISWCSLDLRDFQVPWSQLQQLNLQYDASPYWNPVHSDFLQVLSQCHNLTSLFLGIGAPIDDVDPETIEPVTLRNVHTFKLRSFEINNVSLSLSTFTGHTESLSFLARCADTLESVSFNRLDIADPAMLSCLAQLHHLKTMLFLPSVLRLNHGLYGRAHARRRRQHRHRDKPVPRICPSLETLHLRCSSTAPVNAIAKLATFQYGLDTRDEKIKELQARLKVFVDQGLQLVLTKSSASG
ncbi:hypothetical protein BU15DRAFT_75167 [Melanogaster broomeanus]|nr:hypothetical protein BU15DRAFT_75167 [Melanogaster broomeanus]